MTVENRVGTLLNPCRYVTGSGDFCRNAQARPDAFLYVVRSPHAHAIIRSIDQTELMSHAQKKDLLGVFSYEDLEAEQIGGIPHYRDFLNNEYSERHRSERPILAKNKVRYVGEPVLFVVAKKIELAKDFADMIHIRYEEVPSVTALSDAIDPKSPRVWSAAPGNICLRWATGDAANVEKLIASAKHVVALKATNNRVLASPIETPAAIASYESDSETFLLVTPSQGVFLQRNTLADSVFRVDRNKIQVFSGDVGGSFGIRGAVYPEHVMVLFAARKLGCTVFWDCDRSESFLSDSHSRDQLTIGQLALDENGQFIALNIKNHANVGAYLANYALFTPTMGSAPMLCGAYRIKNIHYDVSCVYTNTVPIDSYRGTGRAEVSFFLERIIDMAAKQLGISPVEIRKRNFICSSEIPYETPTGITYDSGNFEEILDLALTKSDWTEFGERRKRRARSGVISGIGLAYYVYNSGSSTGEFARLRLEENATLSLFVGTQDSGQRHSEIFENITAKELGVDNNCVQLKQGDTNLLPFGFGTGASRSMQIGTTIIPKVCNRFLTSLAAFAALKYRLNQLNIRVSPGKLVDIGSGLEFRVSDLLESAAFDLRNCNPQNPIYRQLLDQTATIEVKNPIAYPNGCHVCEISIDKDTGNIEILRYTSVDDFGVILDASSALGQVHGSVTQGLSQALYEEIRYNDCGQITNGSFLDYHLPRAGEVVRPETSFVQSYPCKSNALGCKGLGESGTVVAPAALINAVVNALSEFGVCHLEMPATPFKVWNAMQPKKPMC
ncbi:xanthine dehydrogenase family protein molybdopterin-binding subunit [Ruegeria sp. SCPT10]|uniref:xanthine dehydrogenase family protein molybdopterin-binding subunit n=1 Tax=Ruegeria sp. SCP10 TaxID=3141377 RepID=UPI003335BDB6